MLQRITQKVVTTSTEHVLLAILWGLPLLYVPGSPMLSVAARWGLLVAVVLIVGMSHDLRRAAIREFRSLNKLSGFLLVLFVTAAVVSTVLGKQSVATRLIGWSGEALGLFTWLSFIVVAVALRSHVRSFIESRLCLLISGLVCALSLLADARLIAHGFRVSGLLIIATSTAIYAALTLGIAVWHGLFVKRNLPIAATVAAVSTVTLVLCQSRIAQFSAIVVCVLYAVHLIRQRKILGFVPLLLVLLLLVIPLFGGVYFTRMRGEQVASGLAYRGDIYRLTMHEIAHEHAVYGLGASGVPQEINNRTTAPPGILESLNQNFVFLSAHDLFLDAALCFGLVGGLSLVVLVLQASYTLLIAELTPQLLLMAGVFFSLLANALCNVPSIELTSLLLVVTVTLLPSRIALKESRTPKQRRAN